MHNLQPDKHLYLPHLYVCAVKHFYCSLCLIRRPESHEGKISKFPISRIHTFQIGNCATFFKLSAQCLLLLLLLVVIKKMRMLTAYCRGSS